MTSSGWRRWWPGLVSARRWCWRPPTAGIGLDALQAVACFCNAENGGFVVAGMDTKRTQGGERIRSLRPLVREQGIWVKYRRVLDSRRFPPPDGLEIDAIDAPGDGVIILIEVPPNRNTHNLELHLCYSRVRATSGAAAG